MQDQFDFLDAESKLLSATNAGKSDKFNGEVDVGGEMVKIVDGIGSFNGKNYLVDADTKFVYDGNNKPVGKIGTDGKLTEEVNAQDILKKGAGQPLAANNQGQKQLDELKMTPEQANQVEQLTASTAGGVNKATSGVAGESDIMKEFRALGGENADKLAKNVSLLANGDITEAIQNGILAGDKPKDIVAKEKKEIKDQALTTLVKEAVKAFAAA